MKNNTLRKTLRKKSVQIGIITAPIPKSHLNQAESYLDKAYVSWVEMSGANAVIIPYNTDALDTYLSLVHGVLWVGGAIENSKTHPISQYKQFLETYRRVFEHAVRENDHGNYFPLWGTCLGFDFLAMMGENLTEGYIKHIQRVEKFRLGTLTFRGKSRLRSGIPLGLQKKTAVTPCVQHIHEYGFDLKSEHTKQLKTYLNIVAVDYADNDVEFMNMFEYKRYPFYGCQWHPEKPLNDLGVEISRAVSIFFKKECAKNNTVSPSWSKVSQSNKFDSKYNVLLTGGSFREKKPRFRLQ